MTKAKIHPPLIRAIAHTRLYLWAYGATGLGDLAQLTELGIDAHAARMPGGIMRSGCVDIGREIVRQHAHAFLRVLDDTLRSAREAEERRQRLHAELPVSLRPSSPTVVRCTDTEQMSEAFCRMICECDDKVLASHTRLATVFRFPETSPPMRHAIRKALSHATSTALVGLGLAALSLAALVWRRAEDPGPDPGEY